ncbi:MAG TPA: transglutaminase family protein [Pirellulales bacterium]|nr:transglutaminase family protein [Pirellulales bacterium]
MPSSFTHVFSRPAKAMWRATYISLLVAIFGGCDGPPPKTSHAAQTKPSTSAPDSLTKETWDVYYMQGERAGYSRTLQQPVKQDGAECLRIESELFLSIKRFGQINEQRIKLNSLESIEGGLRSFTSEVTMGAKPVVSSGHLERNTLVSNTKTAGNTSMSNQEWPAGAGGFFAVDLDLARRPMQPAERRTLSALQPVFNVLGTIELTARDYEPTNLLTGAYDLLRIDCVLEIQGQRIESTLWTDRTGDTLKTRVAVGIEQVTYRATKEQALEKIEPGAFDLGVASTVKLDRPIADAHQTHRAKYRVELTTADPARAFVTGPTQQVVSTGPHSAEITVVAIRPDAPAPDPESGPPVDAKGAPASADRPTDDEREPNDMLQSDDPRVVAMAREAAGKETDPARLAVALEKYVHEKIRRKDFSTALATAAEVARSLQGDCTEHAMLLAALARASGRAARVAIGLVYAHREQGFAFHMWTEIDLNGRWVPLDATLGRGGIGAAHLKLGHSNLKGAAALASFLPVTQVMGQLKIEVIEIE